MTFAVRADESTQRVVEHFSYNSEVTLKRIATGALGADRSVTPTVTSISVACTTPTPFGRQLVDGTAILEGDLHLYLWAGDPRLTFVPTPSDQALLDGDSYEIKDVHRLVGAYELHLRGGGA